MGSQPALRVMDNRQRLMRSSRAVNVLPGQDKQLGSRVLRAAGGDTVMGGVSEREMHHQTL